MEALVDVQKNTINCSSPDDKKNSKAISCSWYLLLHTASKVAMEEDQLIWPTKKTLLVDMTNSPLILSVDRLHALHLVQAPQLVGQADIPHHPRLHQK